MNRVIGFDFIRGLCALGVVLHHLSHWLGGPAFVNFGIYAVYAFFVLAGSSLYIAYSHKISSDKGLIEYYTGRIGRILPLFILVTICYMALSILEGRISINEVMKFFINASLIFGWGNPGQFAIIEGGWSLGIEFVFYISFPMIVVFARSKFWLWLAVLLYLSQQIYIQLIFASGDLKENWVDYTQFLSFAFYFFMGAVIGERIIKKDLPANSNLMALIFSICLAIIIIWSPEYTEETLLGAKGKILPLISVLLIYCGVYIQAPESINKIFRFLGDTSYGLYLFHPLIFFFIVRVIYWKPENDLLFGAIIIAASYIVAYCSVHYFETPVKNAFKNWVKSKL